MTFLLIFNDLKFGKSSLLCCNGYRDAILKILFYESQVEYLRKAFTKKRRKKIGNDIFIAVLLRLYDQNYLISTKSQLSNKKLIIVSEVTLI